MMFVLSIYFSHVLTCSLCVCKEDIVRSHMIKSSHDAMEVAQNENREFGKEEVGSGFCH